MSILLSCSVVITCRLDSFTPEHALWFNVQLLCLVEPEEGMRRA